jgi:hypothetical protein
VIDFERDPRTFEVRAACPHCSTPLAFAPGELVMEPHGECPHCSYRVALCGECFGLKFCVRERGHTGWHVSPSGSSWGRAEPPGILCHRCGKNYSDAVFCSECTARLDAPASAPTPWSVWVKGDTQCSYTTEAPTAEEAIAHVRTLSPSLARALLVAELAPGATSDAEDRYARYRRGVLAYAGTGSRPEGDDEDTRRGHREARAAVVALLRAEQARLGLGEAEDEGSEGR